MYAIIETGGNSSAVKKAPRSSRLDRMAADVNSKVSLDKVYLWLVGAELKVGAPLAK